jgi:hypothetical protein
MQERERRNIEFSRLNVLGKIIFVGGAAARVVSGGIDRVLNHVADIVVESEKAFREGKDDNIEDARILEERKSRKVQPPKRNG